VYAWGYGGEGQLGLGSTYNNPIPMLVGGVLGTKVVVQVAASQFHSAAITEDGRLYTWGAGEDGRLGHGPCTAPETLNHKSSTLNAKPYTVSATVLPWHLNCNPPPLLPPLPPSLPLARPRCHVRTEIDGCVWVLLWLWLLVCVGVVVVVVVGVCGCCCGCGCGVLQETRSVAYHRRWCSASRTSPSSRSL
jgi:hypothetical protein